MQECCATNLEKRGQDSLHTLHLQLLSILLLLRVDGTESLQNIEHGWIGHVQPKYGLLSKIQ